MKRAMIAASLCAVVSPAVAQTTTAPATSDAKMPAVTMSDQNNSAAPVKGVNSFTEAQAKSRIEAKGYTAVSGLTKDPDGIWRGKAMKEGTNHDVALDYQGNVFAQ